MAWPLRRNPGHADVFVSASGDNSVKVWDLRQARPTLNLAAHAYEILVRCPCTLTCPLKDLRMMHPSPEHVALQSPCPEGAVWDSGFGC